MNLRSTESKGFIRRTADEATQKFLEFASLLHGEIFVNLVAYVDESGHHDPNGKLPGGRFAVIGGLVDTKEAFAVLNHDWQSVLNRYSAKGFHFTEFSEASKFLRGRIKEPSDFRESQYFGWSLEKLDAFLFDLAALAGSEDHIWVGGYIDVLAFQEAAANPIYADQVPAGGDPRRFAAEQFFGNLVGDVRGARPGWNGDISVFFDAPDGKWAGMVQSSFMRERERDSTLAEIIFAKKEKHLSLQAADMACYRFRQWAENSIGKGLEVDPIPKLDQLLFKSMFGQFANFGHPGQLHPVKFRVPPQ